MSIPRERHIYDAPEGYKYPEKFEDQQQTTAHANVIVDAYRQNPHSETKVILMPFYQCMDRNSKGMVILGTNNYLNRVMNGSIFGFHDLVENAPDLKKKEASFMLTMASSVTAMKFVGDKEFLVGESDGKITLFNTDSDMRASDQSQQSLFSIGKKNEHKSMVHCLDVFRATRAKAVSGDEDGCLLTWDISGADLVSIGTIRHAHVDKINAVSTAKDNDVCFVTASDDKSVLYWDMRDPRPASALLEYHQFQIKAVQYLNENQFLVGDTAGVVSLIDAKMPKKILLEKEVDDNAIHNLIVNGQDVIILANSNRLQVQKCDGTKFDTILDEVKDIPDYLRAAVWVNDSEFYVAGWSSFIKKYKIPTAN